ncbi:polyhydroxyalkanoate synthesis repressor PhaR [Leptospira interrogans]
MLSKSDPAGDKKEAVVIKKYANRRLYNTETSTYVTLEDLAAMVRSDRDFVVFDAKTGDDLTHTVLTQIIVEQEGRSGGQTLLPIPFLRQLIRFYDDSIGKMVPSYLQMSMETLVKEQERFRSQFSHMLGQNPFGAAAFDAMQEQTRKNMAIFEKAMQMWTPFGMKPDASGSKPDQVAAHANEGQQQPPPKASTPEQGSGKAELDELKAQLASMQEKIEKLSQSRD